MVYTAAAYVLYRWLDLGIRLLPRLIISSRKHYRTSTGVRGDLEMMAFMHWSAAAAFIGLLFGRAKMANAMFPLVPCLPYCPSVTVSCIEGTAGCTPEELVPLFLHVGNCR